MRIQLLKITLMKFSSPQLINELKNKMGKLILKYSALLFILLLIDGWLTDQIVNPIVPLVLGAKINIRGLIYIVLVLTGIIFFIKQSLTIENSLSVLKLTLYSSLFCLIAEFLFQITRIFPIDKHYWIEQVTDAVFRSITMTIFNFFFSFFVAFQIRPRRPLKLLCSLYAF